MLNKRIYEFPFGKTLAQLLNCKHIADFKSAIRLQLLIVRLTIPAFETRT